MSTPLKYPIALREDTVDVIHAQRVEDPYRWLEDGSSVDTEEWSAAEGLLSREHLDALAGREWLRQRLSALHAIGDVWGLQERGPWTFMVRRTAADEREKVLVTDVEGTERVLIDPAEMQDEDPLSLDWWYPSPKGTYVAYATSEGGTEESRLFVLETATGQIIEGPIDRVKWCGLVWTEDERSFFYGRRLSAELVPKGEELLHRRVWRHRLSTDIDNDELVFGDGRDKTEYHNLSLSADGQWLVIHASSGMARHNDVYIIDCVKAAPIRTVQENVDWISDVTIGEDGLFYVMTNRDAPCWRLARCTLAQLLAGEWEDIVPEREEVLNSYVLCSGVILTLTSIDAISRVRVYDRLSGQFIHEIDLPGSGFAVVWRLTRHEGDKAAIYYTDYLTPPKVFVYDSSQSRIELFADAPGKVELGPLAVSQTHYSSADGTDIPLFIMHRKDVPLGGKRPTILYGYGGFGLNATPHFNPEMAVWAEAGGIFAVACIRGGGERGAEWHRSGVQDRKQTSFDDFIAGAQWLIDNEYTTREQLAIQGVSNGGLLVGAVMTQRPDLFAAVDCMLPYLDMVRYEQFAIGETWRDEYGSASDPEEFSWLYGYSPYHHIVKGTKYPAVIFSVGENDVRADPAHARKMCAALQEASIGGIVLYRSEPNAGHRGGSVSRRIDEAVDRLSFVAEQIGLDLSEVDVKAES